MIQQEIMGDLVRTYSELGVKIHGGFPEGDYDEAVDPIESNRVYVETDIPIVEESSEDDEPIEEAEEPAVE